MIHFAKIKNARERMLRPICDFDLQTIFFSPPAAAKLIRHLTWLRKPARKPIPWWWLGIPNQSSKKYGWTCAGCRPGRTRSHGWDPSHELSLVKSAEAAVSFAPSIVTILSTVLKKTTRRSLGGQLSPLACRSGYRQFCLDAVAPSTPWNRSVGSAAE